MKSIEKRKLSFEEFQRGWNKKETEYQKKIIEYAEEREKPLEEGMTFSQVNGQAVVEKDNVKKKVQHFSREYFHYAATAETLVTDAGFFLSFAKRENQTLIFTGEKAEDEMSLRHILQADQVVSEKMKHLAFQKGKKRLLFAVNQGYETAQLSLLLNNIDYETHDVTLLLTREGKKGNQWEDLDSRVRILSYYGQVLYTKKEYAKFLYLRKYAFYTDDIHRTVKEELGALLQREHQRIFADEHFDVFFMYGEFTPWNYISLLGIQSEKKIHIQNYVLEKMIHHWRRGTFTGKYTEFAIEKRIQLLKEFDEICCLSKGLLSYERENSFSDLYQNAYALDVLPDRHRSRKNKVYQEVTYEGKEFLAYRAEEILRLLIKVPKEEHAFLFLLNDLSGGNLPLLKKWIRKKRQDDEFACLYMIDNFEIVSDIQEIELQEEKHIKILRDISLDDEYEKQFCMITEFDLNNIEEMGK